MVMTLQGMMRWTCVQAKGTAPVPRHCHATAVVATRLFIFGGSTDCDGTACNDLFIFDTVNSTWSQPKSKGSLPAPRYGHSMVAFGTRIILFGGCFGSSTTYSDLFIYDTGTVFEYCSNDSVNDNWSEISSSTIGVSIPPRGLHSCCTFGTNLIIFGGIRLDRFDQQNETFTEYGDMYSIDTSTLLQARCILISVKTRFFS